MTTKILVTAALALSVASCANNQDRYLDLNTGQALDLKKDDKTGEMVDAKTGKSVGIYVDTRSKDTVWGKTGKVINGEVKEKDGKWKYEGEDGDVKIKTEDNGETKIKDGDYKKKVEKDGDIIIKDGDKKIKIDGKTGEKKVKND